jgi:hypothetical protein
MTASDTPRYWFCVIGPIPDDKLPSGADLPPRLAARQAVESMTGCETHRCTASGWIMKEEADMIQDATIQYARRKG